MFGQSTELVSTGGTVHQHRRFVAGCVCVFLEPRMLPRRAYLVLRATSFGAKGSMDSSRLDFHNRQGGRCMPVHSFKFRRPRVARVFHRCGCVWAAVPWQCLENIGFIPGGPSAQASRLGASSVPSAHPRFDSFVAGAPPPPPAPSASGDVEVQEGPEALVSRLLLDLHCVRQDECRQQEHALRCGVR